MLTKHRSRHTRWSLAAMAGAAVCFFSSQTLAFSDTYFGYRYGTTFGEPFNDNDIAKHIFTLGHFSTYDYGSNFLNVDFLVSDSTDPREPGSSDGAREAYIVYRNTVSGSKVTGKDLKFGVIRDVGLTLGFDWNQKDDAGYNSRKQMLVAGPTLSIDVPGFLNISLLQLWESNAPCNQFAGTCVDRYHYDPHPMLNLAWGIPLGDTGLKFEGYANFIAEKGKNEFGGDTAAETNIDAKVMYGVTKSLSVGLAYQWWRNKFGNDYKGAAGAGAFAKTPMVRAEYHF